MTLSAGAKPGKPAVQTPCNGDAVQYWTHQGGRLVNAATGLCLAIGHGEARAGKQAILWSCSGDPDQQWSFQSHERAGTPPTLSPDGV